MIDTTILSEALTERFGLEVNVSASQKSSGHDVTIIPLGIESTISFRVNLHLGWRTVTASFVPGNYALELVKEIQTASQSQKAAFVVFANSLISRGAEISIHLDDNQVDASIPDSWPKDWKNIRISMKKTGVLVEKSTGYDFDEVFPWATGFFGLVLALLPLEEIEEPLLGGEAEGDIFIKRVKKYERSRLNRAACIEIHGTDCKICGFSFGECYGELGDGFIHVHHIVPVSEMGGSYILDPAKDLIPVCPNCHSMLHRRKPVLLPRELIQILSKDK